ncbi:hypothetical protein F5Y16DRAFT_390287 [Xylariaceae sp. FL0255]|nr:hypothetical protein F5Y16DRAFT_390287 [Xylariaceae sp. FL0255]
MISEETPDNRRPDTSLLFVHNSGPTHVHGRDRRTNTNIRQHIMRDIGRQRRRRLRNPQLDVVLALPDDSSAGQSATSESNLRSTKPVENRYLAHIARPFWDQHPLSVLESQWGMDMFSAYGIMFMLHSGRNLSAAEFPVESFLVPFAFQKSMFLSHYAQIFTRPDRLAGVSYERPARFKAMALQRAMGSIGCIKSKLATLDSDRAVIEHIICAVIAIISFNLISSDLEQALMHMRGLESLIAARGGCSFLHGANELRLMVFWIDVVISLLTGHHPRFPLPSDLIPQVPPAPYPKEIFLPHHASTDLRTGVYEGYHHISSCLVDLHSVACLIDSNLFVKGDALWEEYVYLGLCLDPLAHRLLDTPTRNEALTSDTMTEAVRQGALLWITRIKRRYRSYPGSPTTAVQRLLDFLSRFERTNNMGDSTILSVQLWLLVLCGIEYDGPSSTRSPVNMLALRMRQMGWRDWEHVMMRVCQLPWTNAFDFGVAHLAKRVRSIL